MRALAGLKALAVMALCLSPGLARAEMMRELSVPMTGVGAFDGHRLIGTWYEVAQTPTVVETDCQGTTVEVAPRDDSRLTIKIACHKGAPDGPVLPIEGIMAEVKPGWFAVRFVRLPTVGALDVIVLWAAEDGSMVVLGNPLGFAGWVWSKTPHPDEAALAAAEAVLVTNGYKPGVISRVKQAD